MGSRVPPAETTTCRPSRLHSRFGRSDVVILVLGLPQDGQGPGDDLLGLRQAPQAGVPAGQTTGVGINDRQAALTQHCHIVPGGGIEPHLGVHSRCQDDGGLSGQDRRSQQIIGPPRTHPRQQVRRGRGDQDQLGPLGHSHVLHRGRVIEDTGGHGLPADRCQCRRPDETQRRLGGHHLDLVPGLTPQSNDKGHLVGGNGTGHADDDAPRRPKGGRGAFTRSGVRLVHASEAQNWMSSRLVGVFTRLEGDRSVQGDVAEHVGLGGATGLLGLGAAGTGDVSGDDLELVLGDLPQMPSDFSPTSESTSGPKNSNWLSSSCWV